MDQPLDVLRDVRVPLFVQDGLHLGDPLKLGVKVLPHLADGLAHGFHVAYQPLVLGFQAFKFGACRRSLSNRQGANPSSIDVKRQDELNEPKGLTTVALPW